MALGGARVIDRSDVAWVEFIVSYSCLVGSCRSRVPTSPCTPQLQPHHTPEGAGTHGIRKRKRKAKGKAESGRTCSCTVLEVRTSARTVPAFSSRVSPHCALMPLTRLTALVFALRLSRPAAGSRTTAAVQPSNKTTNRHSLEHPTVAPQHTFSALLAEAHPNRPTPRAHAFWTPTLVLL